MWFDNLSWFDILSAVILIGAVGREIARGGKAISPTKTTWLIGVGIVAAFGSELLARFNITLLHSVHHVTPDMLEYILIVAVVVNIIFIMPSIAANALIQTAVSVFLLAFVLQFLPEYVPSNSWIYPVVQPIAARAYVFVKPLVDKYLAFITSKIANLKNLDISKMKPTLPLSNGGEIKPTLP